MFKPKAVPKLHCVWQEFGCKWEGEYLEAHLMACDLERLKNCLLQGKENQSQDSEDVNKLIAQTADYISKGVDNLSNTLADTWQNQARPKLNEFVTSAQNTYNTYSQNILASDTLKKAKTSYEDAKKVLSEYFYSSPVNETDEEKAVKLATKASLETYVAAQESKSPNVLNLSPIDAASEKSNFEYTDLAIAEDDFYLINPED